MTLASAIAADCAEQIEPAAEAYEVHLQQSHGDLVALINLAVLYWQVTDFGFSTAYALSPTFVAAAGKRFPILLAQAEHASEAQFWSNYIRWADLGEPFSMSVCEEMLRRDPETIVPAMYIFSVSRGLRCRSQAVRLLGQSRTQPTTKNRYIISVVESAMKRADAATLR